jgi:hypothetical protein
MYTQDIGGYRFPQDVYYADGLTIIGLIIPYFFATCLALGD